MPVDTNGQIELLCQIPEWLHSSVVRTHPEILQADLSEGADAPAFTSPRSQARSGKSVTGWGRVLVGKPETAESTEVVVCRR
jgi:hypothetical protein